MAKMRKNLWLHPRGNPRIRTEKEDPMKDAICNIRRWDKKEVQERLLVEKKKELSQTKRKV